jgi:phage terminase small subunit
MAITKKRRAFIEEYLRCGFNATEAARRAGYKHPNKLGPRLVKVGEIAAEIDRRIRELTMRANEVLLRFSEQARGEGTQYLQEDGTVDIGRLIEDNKQHLVKKIGETRYGRMVEFYDAQTALGQLGRHYGLFDDMTTVTTIELDLDEWRRLRRERLEKVGQMEEPRCGDTD